MAAKDKANLVAALRWRWIFLILAIALPASCGGLFHRQNERLRALADHGAIATATIVETTQGFARYRYTVGSEEYEWSVKAEKAPHAVGETFPVTWLPEDPSLSRPGAYTPDALDNDLDLRLQRGILLGISGFFVLMALWCERTVRRLREGKPFAVRISPASAGRVLAFILWAILLGVELDPDVRQVQEAAFGARPLGLPVVPVVMLAVTILYLPFFWVGPHAMRILMDAQSRGAILSRSGIVLAIFRAGPAMRVSQVIVLAGLAWGIGWMAAWIAYASHLGI